MHRLTKHKELLGTVSIIIATLCWGFSGCSGQYLLHDLALPTPVVLCIRQISAGIILILLDLIFRKKDSKAHPHPSIWQSREDTMTLVFFAIFGICLTQFTFLCRSIIPTPELRRCFSICPRSSF